MDLYIYDQWLNELGIVDVFVSLIWTPRFYDVGYFELKVPITDNNIELLQKHRYIYREDVGEAGFIESISDSCGEDGNYMIVAGSMLNGLLDKRTIALPNPLQSFSLNKMMSWLNDKGSDMYRYDCFSFDPGDGSIDYYLPPESDCKNMGDYCRNMLRADSRIFKIDFCPGDVKKIVCRYAEGVDRSADQDINPHVIFAAEYGNIYNTIYNYSSKGCYNYVRVTADINEVSWDETRGTEYSLYVEKHNGTTGLSRSMILLRDKPVIVKEERATVGGTITVNVLDYDETKKRQTDILNQYFCEYTENFKGTAVGDGYRTEWQLGDYITIRDDKRGISYKKQIEEVTEVFESDAKTVTVVFGDNLKTIIDLAKEAKK